MLSMVDSGTETMHFVAVETAALYRRSGRYPTLCDSEVISASMLTEPGGQCQECLTRARAGADADRRRRRARLRLSACRGPAVRVVAHVTGADVRTEKGAGQVSDEPGTGSVQWRHRTPLSGTDLADSWRCGACAGIRAPACIWWGNTLWELCDRQGIPPYSPVVLDGTPQG